LSRPIQRGRNLLVQTFTYFSNFSKIRFNLTDLESISKLAGESAYTLSEHVMFNDESTLLAVERQRIIREILEREGVVRNAELKQLLQVSAVTIRSDLRELESNGICQTIWGGAVYLQPLLGQETTNLAVRSNINHEAKQRIGARAAQLIEVGQTLIVDAGTTTIELVRHLPRDLDYLRIVTPALNIADAATQFPQVELVMTGGILRNLTHSLIGPQVMRSLEMFNADWAFIASGGYSLEHGVTTGNMLEVEVKRTMIQQANRVALLADSSKYGTVMSLNVAPIRAVDFLVTDTGLSDSHAEALTQYGVEVLRV
jgi:DeoR/GlpR family transcriptional regulator of sugar metabolism